MSGVLVDTSIWSIALRGSRATENNIGATLSQLIDENRVKIKGIQGSHTGFLSCAVAIRSKLSSYTNDKDFKNYKQYLPITLL